MSDVSMNGTPLAEPDRSDAGALGLVTASMAEPLPLSSRLCIVGPGRHSPVLGVMTEHVIAALSQQWSVSTVQVGVPGDVFDSTLIGLNVPELVRVPSLVESHTQSRVTRQRRLRRFFVRERPDVVMIDMWSMRQISWAATLARAATATGARVAVRCCGRLDEHLGLLDRRRLRRLLQRIDLLITQGHMPSALDGAPCAILPLPEWKTEERQVDPHSTEVIAFLPVARCDEGQVLLRAFDGLSDERVAEFSLVIAQLAGSQTAELEEMIGASHHREHIATIVDWLGDTQLERRIAKAGVVVSFNPTDESRVLDAAVHHGVPLILVRDHNAGPGQHYSGATVSPLEPASLLASIERANLARRYRYPETEQFLAGASALSARLYSLTASRQLADER